MGDAFDTLNIPARFDVDEAAVQRAYLAGVAASHPDLAGDTPRAAEAARRAAVLNRARAELLDPETRARALLRRLGAAGEGDERELPEGFLEHMLQTRMEMEEAVEGGDAAEVARLRAWAEQERGRHIERVGRLFARALPGPAGAGQIQEIRRELNAWRYIERMIEQLGAHEPGAGTTGHLG